MNEESSPVCAGNIPRRVLVTGGRGFIGVNLVRALHASGVQVRAFDNLSLLPEDPTRDDLFTESREWQNQPTLIRGDIRDMAAMSAAMVGAEAVVHLAANSGVQQSMDDPLADMDCNIRGTLTCLTAARDAGIRRFIFASSGAPLGATTPPVEETTLPCPISPYGVSKLAGEAYAQAYAHSFGMETFALRFANVYGPFSDHKSSVVGRFLRHAVQNIAWEIFGDGQQTRDFIFVGDLVAAILLALSTKNPGGEVLHIASSTETSVNELAAILAKMLEACGHPCPQIETLPARAGDMARSRANIKKAARILGWEPRVKLEDGLRRTVTWFLENKA